ncbi:MAG: cyclic-di-AMP receptor [Lactobacillaceae bacterium]|jgi:uncharacterized protein YaaQ|nr:cyclic-di-AMP receptor [Lactobacillaceae bacterium]
MKLITAIVQEKDANPVANALVENDIRATRLNTAGGFLRSGNATFIIATEDNNVDNTIQIISDNSKKRTEFVTPPVALNMATELTEPLEVTVGGATIIVQDIERFEQI